MSTMNKLGLHILGGYKGNLGKPRIVKLVDPSPEYIAQVRAQVGAACTMVVRWTESEQPLDNPVQRAQQWYAKRKPQMVDAEALYESLNELSDDHAPAYAAFLVEMLRLMHAGNRRCAVGSWSVGVPDLPVWETYEPVLRAMTARDALSLHEYWADAADLGNIWHVGRWRMVPALAPHKKIVTECGRDRFTENGRTWGYSGWHADPQCSENAYLAELRGLNAIYAPDPTVLGAVVFTAGQIVDAQWRPFEVNSLAPIIVAEQGPQPGAPVTPTPKPPSKPRLVHPLPWSRVSQRFGDNPAYYKPLGFPGGHPAIDLACPDISEIRAWHATPVVAANSGPAVIANDRDGYGIYVYLWGEDSLDTLYAHLAWATLPQSKRVRAGDFIGWVGYTGNCEPLGIYGEHLHFGVRPRPYNLNNGTRGYVDPLPYLG